MNERYSWNTADLIIPVFSIILAVYYMFTIRGIPRIAQMYGGSLSIIVIILSVVMFALVVKNGLFKKISNPMKYIKNNWNDSNFGIYKKVAVLISLVIIYISLLPYAGYPITSMIFMSLVMYFLGMRKITRILGVAVFVTSLGFCLFILFLNVQLPLDIISYQIKSLIR